MKRIIFSFFLGFIGTLSFAQSNVSVSSEAKDTLIQQSPALPVREAVITDEGTNEPGSDYEKTTLNGKDIYIKKENQITIIYEPQ